MAGTTLCVLYFRGCGPYWAFRLASQPSDWFADLSVLLTRYFSHFIIPPPPIKNQGGWARFVDTHNSTGFFQGILTKKDPHNKKQAPKDFHPQGLHLSRRLPIFTRRFQRTILGTSELNFCVRNGNRWNLTVIVTDQYDWFSITFLFYFVQCFLKDVPSKLNNHC